MGPACIIAICTSTLIPCSSLLFPLFPDMNQNTLDNDNEWFIATSTTAAAAHYSIINFNLSFLLEKKSTNENIN